MTAPHERLRARLGDPALYLDDPADTARYARDWIGKYVGTAPLVVRPRSTEEVVAVLTACSELDVPVVPQAGNTGMVGGGVPRAGEVVLSVERMGAIEAFDEASATVRVQAGVVLETLQDFLAERGYDMPVDLGGRGSCQLGGMIATNAGGVKVLRYGHMREQVRGLEVVLADGTVVSGLNILKKNNTGLDLKQIFIGSEGTLGVITRAVLQVQPAPEAFQTALAGLARRDLLPALLQAARARFPRLSSLEFIDGATVAYVRNADPDLRIPLAGEHASLVVIEEESAAGEAAGEAFAAGLESLLTEELIVDAVVAGSEAQARAIWRVREEPTEAVSRRGLTHKFDVTVPPGVIPAFLGEMEALAEGFEGVRVVLFGHLGDGNVHVNMAQEPGLSDDAFRAMEPALADAIYGAVHGRAGSISAEHGIGVMKRAYLSLARTPEEIALMRTLKRTLDPKGILNPGVILD